ncbi:MAG: hypothetical protein IJ515_01540 [Clostridia bacterium]|nr:hypothetical protein [Clostridia bacterium]
MKKNSWIFIICGIFVIAALAVMLVFVFSDKGDEPTPEPVDITGTWEVVSTITAGAPALVDNQFVVITEDTFTMYKDSTDTPHTTSKYELDGAKLKLTDISKKYDLEVKTKNHIRLFEGASFGLVLVRYPNADFSPVSFDASKLIGKWQVKYRSTMDTQALDEALEFTATEVTDYRNGLPNGSSSYTVEGNILTAPFWNMQVEVHYYSEDRIFFVEPNSGNAWEIENVNATPEQPEQPEEPEQPEQPEEPENTTSAFDGTWEIVSQVTASTHVLIDNQFVVIGNGSLSMYKDGSATPYATSSYKVENGKLILPDISREYDVEVKTANHIRLFAGGAGLVLVRYPNADFSPVTVDTSKLVGKWQVKYRSAMDTDPTHDEALEFTATEITDYRNGAAVATAGYTLEDGVLTAAAFGMTLEVHYYSEDIIFLVEVATGNAWELEKIN